MRNFLSFFRGTVGLPRKVLLVLFYMGKMARQPTHVLALARQQRPLVEFADAITAISYGSVSNAYRRNRANDLGTPSAH